MCSVLQQNTKTRLKTMDVVMAEKAELAYTFWSLKSARLWISVWQPYQEVKRVVVLNPGTKINDKVLSDKTFLAYSRIGF